MCGGVGVNSPTSPLPHFPTADIDRWFEPEFYGYGTEEARRVADTNVQICGQWWNRWTQNADASSELVQSAKCKVQGMEVRPVRELFGTQKGMCLVAGAGKSLNRNIEEVKRLADEGATVMGVDRAFAILKSEGIKPSLTLTRDASERVVDFFPMDLVEGDDVFVVSVVCSPEVFERCGVRNGEFKFRTSALPHSPTPTLYMYSDINPFSPFWNLYYQRYGYEYAGLLSGYVVTFSLVDLVWRMGFDRVVTIGNELCYGSEDEVRAEGYREVVRVGDGRFANRAFHCAAGCFSLFPRMCPEVEFIDCSGGIVKDWKIKRLEDVKPQMNIDEHRLERGRILECCGKR